MLKPLAYSYIRMSTDIQLRGDSLRRQAELSKNYALRHDLELVEDFELSDIGVSAFKGANVKHGNLGKFIQAAENGEIPVGSYLLVESLDRLSRQKIGESLSLFQRITQTGVNLVTLSDEQVYHANETDLTQMIISLVIMARANEESELKSQRISSAWVNKRNNIGRKVLTKRCPAWLQVSPDRSELLPIRNRVKIIRKIFEAASNGQGSHLITRLLNSKEMKNFGSSSIWTEAYVTKILKNRAVIGEFQPHQMQNGKRVPIGEVIEGYYPKIIDEDLFLKVQSDRRGRLTNGGGRVGQRHSNLFTHLVKCAYCNAPMHFISRGKGPRGGSYLKCRDARSGSGCSSKSWNYEKFETSFFQFVSGIDIVGIIEGSNRRTASALLREEIQIENERLVDLKRKQEKTYEMVIEGNSDEAFLRDKLSDLSDQIAQSETTIKDLITRADGTKLEINTSNENPVKHLELLRSSGAGQVFEKRALVASSLKKIIETIEVAAAGRTPQKHEAAKWILNETTDTADDRIDDSYKQKILDALLEDDHSNSLNDPYFQVNFFDGTHILVRPQKKDPTKLYQRIMVKKGDLTYETEFDRGVPLKASSHEENELIKRNMPMIE